MFSRCAFYFLTIVVFPIGVQAQEVLSFKQCVDIAKRNNAEIRAAEEAIQVKSSQVQSARGSYYPQLSGNLTYQQTGPESSSTQASGTSFGANLSATQNIFNGFADGAKVDQLKEDVRSARAALQISQAKVSYDLKSAFANLLYVKETEKLAKDFLKRREDNFRMVELRFQNGRENKGSLLLSQAYLGQAKLDALKANNNRQTSLADLSKVLGRDEEVNFDIQDKMPLQEPPSMSPDIKSLATQAPLRLQAEAQVASAQAGVVSAQAGFYPTLNLSGSVGKSDEAFFPERDRWAVGATLSWPLFGGGKDYFANQSANSSLFVAKFNLHTVERGLLASLRKAQVTYVEAVAELAVSEAFLNAAKVRAEIARSKYNNGLMTFDEWDIIENDLINKSKNYLLAKRDRIVAEAAWEQAQGTGVFNE